MDETRDGTTLSTHSQTLENLREIDFADGKFDSQGQGTTLLELLSLEIQMYDKMGKADMVKVCPSVVTQENLRHSARDRERHSTPMHCWYYPRVWW